MPILALTTEERVARWLALTWGVHPVFAGPYRSFREMIDIAERLAVAEGFCDRGSTIVFLAGFPVGSSVNTLRICGVP